MTAPDDFYGVEREEETSRRKPGWAVKLRRQGRLVTRLFKDGLYGSAEAALEQARAYRDAVLAAVPPRTNHEQATQLRRTNRSGISGVCRVELKTDAYWQAQLTTSAEQRKVRFLVSQHGEEAARERAIEQRRRWLEALPPTFLTHSPHADAVSRQTAADRLVRAIDVTPQEALSREEFDRRLADVNARFDALTPRQLRVRIKRYSPYHTSVAVSDGGRPARRSLTQIRDRGRSMPVLLVQIRQIVAAKVEDLYGESSSCWFMRRHGDELLSSERFAPEVGVNVCVVVPCQPGPSSG